LQSNKGDINIEYRHGVDEKVKHGQSISQDLIEGVEYLTHLNNVTHSETNELVNNAILAFQKQEDYNNAVELALSDELHTLFIMHPQKKLFTESRGLPLYVDREKAGFSTWYRFFPRSASDQFEQHGTFKDCEALLPKISDMGFDVVSFPPIHPIGEINRKGKNNSTTAREEDVGSPWSIGSKFGGHREIHPDLGNIEDFRSLLGVAKMNGIEIAMDFVVQVAPDHPIIEEHPGWFKYRPDRSLQFLENPPHSLDIVPFDFESKNWRSLWEELLRTIFYWIEQGVKIFKIDNPHTKPLLLWDWLINEVKYKYPDVLFLSDAITKPKVMDKLAKLGFTQSFTYFISRSSKIDLEKYVKELTKTDKKEFFKPSFWPNTIEINPFELQTKQESIYLYRHFLAATLSSNYGIYGPVYELMEAESIPGDESYLNSEKYQIGNWDWQRKTNITDLITKINGVRRRELALQQTNNIKFLTTDNDQLIAYLKWDQEKTNFVLCVVNLDPHYSQKGLVQLPRHLLGAEDGQVLQLKDLISGNSYEWRDLSNQVELSSKMPYHLFRLEW